MTYFTGTERQTKDSLFEKTLSLPKVKNIVEQKIGYLSVYFDSVDRKMNIPKTPLQSEIYCLIISRSLDHLFKTTSFW